jgi:hypothetical protein
MAKHKPEDMVTITMTRGQAECVEHIFRMFMPKGNRGSMESLAQGTWYLGRREIYLEVKYHMQIIAPPKIGWRVCLKYNREATGIVTEVSSGTNVIEDDKGNDTFQRNRYHNVRVRWEHVPQTGPNDWISCCIIEILTPRTADEIVKDLREMVKRRKRAYGYSHAANDTFLKDEVLQEVIAILKGT